MKTRPFNKKEALAGKTVATTDGATPHKELPEGIELPKGYRLIEKDETIRIGSLSRWDGPGWRIIDSVDHGTAIYGDFCAITPDYSTGLWKESHE